MSYTAKELLSTIQNDLVRDEQIKQYILAGYVPSWQQMVPVVNTIKDYTGNEHTLTFYCYPDYLRIGDDYDSIIVNMSHDHASEIAEKLGCILPTRKMVDLIYLSASVKLNPTPMQWGPLMQSTTYMIQSNSLIESQKRTREVVNGELIAGHKKDVVISANSHKNPGREAIYGWHQANGKVIQPLSFAHDTRYSDYSHGARMVLKTGYLDGEAVNLSDIISDPAYCELLSDEGPFKV